MRVLQVTNDAVDLAETDHPFVQGADVVALAPGALQLQGSADGSTGWESIGAALVSGVAAQRKLTHRYIRCSTEATISLLST